MKRLPCLLFGLLLTAAGAAAQPTPLYENFGTISDNSPIDATAFANYGSFTTFSTLPFDFQDTQYFTNRGTMTGNPGFRFATASSTSPPFRPASNFVNQTRGVVNVNGGGGGIFFGGGGLGGANGQILSPTYLLVSADTIQNQGQLIAGAAGLLQLTGVNVDLSRGGIGIGRVEESSTHFRNDSNYFPDPGIYDVYWGGETNDIMRVTSLLSITKTATNVASPTHQINRAGGFGGATAIRLSNPTVSISTNAGGADPTSKIPTNIIRQIAFVALSDTNLSATVKWAPSSIANNNYKEAIIEITLPDTNTITGDPELTTIYFSDMLASSTNYTFLANLAANPPTQIPGTYDIARNPPPEWFSASGGNSSTLTNTFFYDAKDTNFTAVVTNFYAAYSAQVDDLASQPIQVSGFDVTQNPGRVEINAQNLDMDNTRIRGTGLVSIKTSNLTGATNLFVDSENVLFNLGVPSGTLNVQKMLSDKVVRLNGTLRAYSAIWTNALGVQYTNTVTDSSGATTNELDTQVVEIDYHMLILDATGLVGTKPVLTHDFVTTAPQQVIINDPMTVENSFVANTPSLTLNNRLTLTGNFVDWGATNAPGLSSLTIGKAGVVTIPNVGNFGQDTSGGYAAFTNNGYISANGLLITANSFVSSGTLTSLVDGIVIGTQSGQFQGANTDSAGLLQISGSDLRFTASTNQSLGVLILNATGSLSDSGAGASNVFVTGNGFQLPNKPGFGDLLGTTIKSIAPRFAQVDHIWAGEDRGASAAGFQDNEAIGQLILGGDRNVLLTFRGTGGQNAMYVDYLALDGSLTNAFAAGNLSSALQIDPNFTIYFADSNEAADQLTQQSGGRLVHVDYAGPADFVQVPTMGGGTAQMSLAARNSTTLDSDGDGIPNAYDPFPLDPAPPVQLSGVRAGDQTSIVLSWQAQPQMQYRVEYSSSLQTPDWQTLTTFTNSGSGPQNAVVHDQMSGDHGQRYYRVRFGQ